MIDQIKRSEGTAHDVKGLLVRAGLALEMLEKNECEKVRKHVLRVSRAFEQLSEICLREFDEDREWSFSLKSFDAQDVKRLLREVIGVARMKSNQSRSDIQFRIHVDSSVRLTLDRLTFFRAMFNLVINATEAIRQGHGTKVTVSAQTDGQWVWIDISDDGPGLPRHVFKTFASWDQPAPSNLATGLRIARNLIAALNGSLSLVETGSKGTTLRISMPLLEAATDQLIAQNVPTAFTPGCNSRLQMAGGHSGGD